MPEFETLAADQQRIKVRAGDWTSRGHFLVEETPLQKADIGGACNDCHKNDSVYGMRTSPARDIVKDRRDVPAQPARLGRIRGAIGAADPSWQEGRSEHLVGDFRDVSSRDVRCGCQTASM